MLYYDRLALWPVLSVLTFVVRPCLALSSSLDCNGNGVPDECDVMPLVCSAAAAYAVTNGPAAMTPVDLDGDGDVDLAVANAAWSSVPSARITLLFNQGDGVMTRLEEVAVGRGPTAVVAADFNRDSHQDLAVANKHSDNVSVLLNLGSGVFSPAVSYAVGNGPSSMVAGDFNGDDAIDLAVANPGPTSGDVDQTVSVLLNAGDGTFEPATHYGLGERAFSLVTSDLNGDDDLDLVVALNGYDTIVNDGIAVLSGHGDGTFANPVTIDRVSDPRVVTVGDFDGDADPDLVVSKGPLSPSQSNHVFMLVNDGSGSFAEGEMVDFDERIVVAERGDVDGDGDLDLAILRLDDPWVGNDMNELYFLVNSGRGSFAAPATLGSVMDPGPAAILADFNGDGRLDLAVGNDDEETVAVVLAGPGPISADCNINGVPDECDEDCNGNDQPDDCDLADGISNDCNFNDVPDECDIGNGTSDDCNGNGVPDECDLTPRLDQTQSLLPPPDVGLASDCALGDLNGDEVPDLVLAYLCPPGLSVLFGNGDTTFALQTHHPLDAASRAPALADVEGDGDLDLLVASSDDQIRVFRNDATGTFVPDAAYPVEALTCASAVDLDNDGDPDLAVASAVNMIFVLFNEPGGVFVPAGSYGVGERPTVLAADDFDGNGFADLVVVNADSADLSVLLNAGTDAAGAWSGFAPAMTVIAGDNPRDVAVGDLNGDTLPDVAVANSGIIEWEPNDWGVMIPIFTEGEVWILVNACHRPHGGWLGFEPVALSGGGPNPTSVTAADLDGDDDLDLVVPNVLAMPMTTSDFVGTILLRNRGDGTFAASRWERWAYWAPSVLAAGDLDVDGDTDLVRGGLLTLKTVWRNDGPASLDINGNDRPDECDSRGSLQSHRRRRWGRPPCLPAGVPFTSGHPIHGPDGPGRGRGP